MQGDIEYVTDSFLIERTIFALYRAEEGIEKTAALDDMLGGIANSIKSWIGSQIHGKDAVGVGRTISNFLVPAMFFRAHPLLGIAATAAQTMGIDLFSIFEKIVNVIKPKIESGQPVTAAEVNQAAKSAAPQLTADASFLEPLARLERTGFFNTEISKYSGKRENLLEQLGLQVKKKPGQNMVSRMFSGMGTKAGGSIIIGLIVWFIKTVLLSAGLLTAGGMVASQFGKKPPLESGGKPVDSYTPDASEKQTETQSNQNKKLTPRSTGAGQHVWKKNPGDFWIEELDPGEKPFERILRWTYASYPDLSQYQDIILRTPSFWNAVSRVKSLWDGGAQMEIPDPFKKRADVINLFVNDVYRAINEGTP